MITLALWINLGILIILVRKTIIEDIKFSKRLERYEHKSTLVLIKESI